ncbi:MAG: uroporphyrinogen-III C-methyltransferase, partial [Burkholderiales bacterium]
GVTFGTGHTRAGAAVNWAALAASGTTLVIYMGMARLAAIVAQLQSAGMSALTPVAVIEHGTLPSQRSLATTLAALPRQVAQHGFGSPAVVVIGDVVNHARIGALAEIAACAA